MHKIKVLKFGGGVFADPYSMPAIGNAIEREIWPDYKIIAVVSAMGNTTYNLRQTIPGHLVPDKSLRELQEDSAPDIIESARRAWRAYDAFISTGENMAAAMLEMHLLYSGFNARSFTGEKAGIRTDGMYNDADIMRIDTDLLRNEFKNIDVAVVTGFQGGANDGGTATLGLNGSDTTAVEMAGWFNAEKCIMYKDVDGIYDGNPKDPKSRLYEFVTPETLLSGDVGKSGIVHDKALNQIKRMHKGNAKVQIFVRNIDLSRRRFTTICKDKVEFYR